MKCNAALTNQVEVVQPQALLHSEEISEVHVCNPNYKGKNYDPNFQAKHVEATHTASNNSKQQQQSSTMANQYKTTYHKTASTYGTSNNNAPLTSSLDIVGEVTLKTSIDGYQLLKVNEMIKNAVTWRARMPKMSKFSKYFDNSTKEGTQGTPEPPTPYVNQTAVNQHMGTQPARIPPRMSTGPMNLQPPTKTPHHRCQVTFSRNDCPLLMRCWHPHKIILLTIQIHHLRMTPGLKVQTGKALSKYHQHHLPPLHQWKSQDLFVGTVVKQDT